MTTLRRWTMRLMLSLLLLGIGSYAAFSISPWPMVGLVRLVFGMGAESASAALEPHVPVGVETQADLNYDATDPDAFLDLHRPAQRSGPLPVVVWTHGGAWVSGSRRDVSAYSRLLASRGYAVAAIGYTLAPTAHHPEPVRQANRALGWLSEHSTALGLDMQRVVLAGDSAGAHISAQLVTALGVPAYADALGLKPALPREALRGAVLFCGPYDTGAVKLDGAFGPFLRGVLWAYSGTRDFANDPTFAPASVLHHVTADFPPTFISAGNGDPLLLHSEALAKKLGALGVPVDALFFPPDTTPRLGHEYQFTLNHAAGQQPLARVEVFLRRVMP